MRFDRGLISGVRGEGEGGFFTGHKHLGFSKEDILRSVDFWGRKFVKTAPFYCAHRAVSPSLSGASHAIPAPEIYTTEYRLRKLAPRPGRGITQPTLSLFLPAAARLHVAIFFFFFLNSLEEFT